MIVRWRVCHCASDEVGAGHVIVECVAEGCRSAWISPQCQWLRDGGVTGELISGATRFFLLMADLRAAR